MYNAHRGMGPAPTGRLNELLDQVRQEFDSQTNRSAEYDQQMSSQMQEMEMVRQKIFSLEQAHMAIKQRYEDELARLRHELDLRGGPSNPSGPPHAAPHSNPPTIGNSGGTGLFGNIMTGQGGPGAPGLPPTAGEPPHPAGPPGASGQPPAPGQPPYQFPQGNYQPNQPQPPPVSPGRRNNNPPPQPRAPPPGPATPQQNPNPYPGGVPGSPIARPTPPRITDVGNQLADLNPDNLPAHQKREADDWFAVFNPRVPRTLDVELVHNLQHDSVVCCVRFSQDGRYVATGCNHSAQIFDVNTGKKVVELQDETVDKPGDLYIRSVCFSPDGKYLATGAEDKLIRVWEIETKRIKHTFAGHEQDIYSLDFSRNGRSIASGSGDRTVRVWDLEMNREALSLTIEDGVTTVAMSPDAMLVAAGSLDRSVRVWDTRGGILTERLDGPEGHKDSVYSVAFAPDGRTLVSGSLDKTIKMWELGADRNVLVGTQRQGRCIRTFEGHKDYVLSVALTPDNSWVLSGSKDRGVQFWDPRTGDVQLMLQGHKNSVISVAPSPQGQLFATGSGDMRARIWRYHTWQGAGARMDQR